jgi:SAM-dependent methyltransferase
MTLVAEKDNNVDKNNILETNLYLDVLYSTERRPISNYPQELAKHLCESYFKKEGSIIDIGCGRGDMLKAFHKEGISVTGTDISPSSMDACKPHLVKVCDIEKVSLPFQKNEFDYVFSKSVIEHLNNPMNFFTQALHVLKPEGTVVIMTPSWVHTAWGPFYLDYTHVTPFTQPSLRDAMVMAGFEDVEVIHFHQLPFLWRKPWLKPLIRTIAQLPLRYRPMHETNIPPKLNTFFRFSKEVMLLGVGRKPKVR